MPSLGEKLRRARVEHGLEIADVASSTKIGGRFLEALETDRRDLLPAGFFFRNWALQYASALSLNRAEIQAQVDRLLSEEAPLRLPGQGVPVRKRLPRLRRNIYRGSGTPRLLVSFGLLFVVVLGCSGFYAWWHKARQARETQLTQAAASISAAVIEVKSADSLQAITIPADCCSSAREHRPALSSRLAKKSPSASSRRMRARRLRRASRSKLKSETQTDSTFE